MLVCSVLPRLTFVFYCILQAERQTLLLEELRKRAKLAVKKRVAKRVERYKNKLKKQLPSQIAVWGARETRLLNIVSGTAGVPIAALLVRQCPDPPEEVDPDTDDECKTDEVRDEKEANANISTDDPTLREWTESDQSEFLPVCPPLSPITHTTVAYVCAVSGVALEISEKQRVRLQQQAMSMAQYCGMMHNRAKSMLRFIQKECPSNRGDVLTQFKKKYPMYGLRTMTMNIIKKFGKFVLFLFASCLLVSHTHTHTHHIQVLKVPTRLLVGEHII